MRPELKRVATLTPYPERAGGIVTYVSAEEFLYRGRRENHEGSRASCMKRAPRMGFSV